MRLDSARELKAALLATVIDPLAESAVVKSAGQRAQSLDELAVTPTIALGLSRRGTGPGDVVLAVRVQRRGLEDSAPVETIRKRAKGEVDVRYVGEVVKRAAPPWHQRANRPLRIGGSIAHHRVTAGTLGAFLRDRATGRTLILSNNHVLADENRGRVGDAILQPGPYDGGDAESKVGELFRSIRLKKVSANAVDAAVASIDPGIDFDHRTITGVGKLAGLNDPILAEGETVAKVGRTTGKTTGRITAFEVDRLVYVFGVGTIRFDGQFEIEGAEDDPFSSGGDSGSLILDEGRRGIGLLFAGSDLGGANGKGLTYANPLRAVLEALKVDLILGDL